MAQHDRIAHAELIKSLHEQSCLGCCGPNTRAGALAVAEAWPAKAANKSAGAQKGDTRANREILDQRAIAMEQHHARSGGITTIEIMKSHSLALRESANRWVPPFRHDREYKVTDCQDKQDDHNNHEDGFCRGHFAGSPDAGSIKLTSRIAAR